MYLFSYSYLSDDSETHMLPQFPGHGSQNAAKREDDTFFFPSDKLIKRIPHL
jgi:hypothetical protein